MNHRAIVFIAALLTVRRCCIDRPFAELAYTPSLDLNAMDRSVDPCEDLYTYSCGGWQRRNPFRRSIELERYGKLYADTQQHVWGFEEAAKPAADRSATRQRIGDYFAACMDDAAIEARGVKPLEPQLARIGSLGNVRDLPGLLGELHASVFTSGLFFDTGAEQDARDATQVITAVYAGGIGLPDRDYYVKDDERSREIRARYRQHVQKMLELVGAVPAEAQRQAATVMRIETALATASSRLERRDLHNIYHRTTVAELQKEMPRFGWSSYFTAAGFKPELLAPTTRSRSSLRSIVFSAPNRSRTSRCSWVGLLHAQASYVSKTFSDEDFASCGAFCAVCLSSALLEEMRCLD
jgi:endothelin-converting enzyme/putative endopeptidase